MVFGSPRKDINVRDEEASPIIGGAVRGAAHRGGDGPYAAPASAFSGAAGASGAASAVGAPA